MLFCASIAIRRRSRNDRRSGAVQDEDPITRNSTKFRRRAGGRGPEDGAFAGASPGQGGCRSRCRTEWGRDSRQGQAEPTRSGFNSVIRPAKVSCPSIRPKKYCATIICVFHARQTRELLVPTEPVL